MGGAAEGIELLPAAPDEAEAIGEMARRIWPAAYGAILPPGQIDYMLAWMYSPERLRREMEEGCAFHWIVRGGGHGGERVGFVGHGAVVPGGACALHKLYLLPELQRLGVGSLALAQLRAHLAGAGAISLELRVNRHNSAAIAFYRKNGFSTRSEDVLEIGGGFVMDDYVMARELP